MPLAHASRALLLAGKPKQKKYRAEAVDGNAKSGGAKCPSSFSHHQQQATAPPEENRTSPEVDKGHRTS
jgi:hypothetical protein